MGNESKGTLLDKMDGFPPLWMSTFTVKTDFLGAPARRNQKNGAPVQTNPTSQRPGETIAEGPCAEQQKTTVERPRMCSRQ